MIPSGWELVLVVVVIMVLFGYKRLPDATRSLGQSMRIFKSEAKGLRDEPPTDASGSSGSAAGLPPAAGAGGPAGPFQPAPPGPPVAGPPSPPVAGQPDQAAPRDQGGRSPAP